MTLQVCEVHLSGKVERQEAHSCKRHCSTAHGSAFLPNSTHTPELTARMPTRETLEPIIQNMRVLLRADRVVRQPIHRRIVCTLIRLTPRNGIRSRPAHTHLDDLRNDARDSETHEQAQDGIVNVPSTLVDETADDDYECQWDSERDDEEQRGRDVFRFEGPLNRDIRQRELPLVTSDSIQHLQDDPTSRSHISSMVP